MGAWLVKRELHNLGVLSEVTVHRVGGTVPAHRDNANQGLRIGTP